MQLLECTGPRTADTADPVLWMHPTHLLGWVIRWTSMWRCHSSAELLTIICIAGRWLLGCTRLHATHSVALALGTCIEWMHTEEYGWWVIILPKGSVRRCRLKHAWALIVDNTQPTLIVYTERMLERVAGHRVKTSPCWVVQVLQSLSSATWHWLLGYVYSLVVNLLWRAHYVHVGHVFRW